MNKAQYLLRVASCFYEDHGEYEPENVPDITSDDTVIQGVTDPGLICPTCGSNIISPKLTTSQLQCPGCNHMIKDIGAPPLSGLRPRRVDLEMTD